MQNKVDTKELTSIVIVIVERYMSPTSKIVLKESSANDLTQSTAGKWKEFVMGIVALDSSKTWWSVGIKPGRV